MFNNNLQEILQRHPFLMFPKFEMKSCQWYGVKRIKSYFADTGIVNKVWSTFLLPHRKQ